MDIAELEIDPVQLESCEAAVKEQIEAVVREEPGAKARCDDLPADGSVAISFRLLLAVTVFLPTGLIVKLRRLWKVENRPIDANSR